MRRMRNGLRSLFLPHLPVYLLPLLRRSRSRGVEGLCFLERGGLTLEPGLEVLRRELELPSVATCSLMLRRPSREGGLAAVLRQLLSEKEASTRVSSPRLAQVERACVHADLRTALRQLETPTRSELVSVLAGRAHTRDLERLQWVSRVFFDTHGPALSFSRRRGAATFSELLAELRARRLPAGEARLLRQALSFPGLSGKELSRRLEGCPLEADALAQAFAPVLENALEGCRFTEPEALGMVLRETGAGKVLSRRLVFVDDSVTSGETCVVLAMLTALFHPGKCLSLFALCTEHPGLIMGSRHALMAATGRALLPEGLPELCASFWDWTGERYQRVAYRDRAADPGPPEPPELVQHLSDAGTEGAPLVADLSAETRRGFLESALLERFSGRRGFWEAHETELFHRGLATEAALSEEPLERVSEAASALRDWARLRVERVSDSLLHPALETLQARACARWQRQHEDHRRRMAACLRMQLSAPGRRRAVRRFLDSADLPHHGCCDEDPLLSALLSSPLGEVAPGGPQ